MKVFDLQCEQGHVFEAWLGSEGELQQQLASGLLQCPICGSSGLSKRLSAPRLNLRANRRSQARPEAQMEQAEHQDRTEHSTHAGTADSHAQSAGVSSGALVKTTVSPQGHSDLGAPGMQAQMLVALRQMVAAAEDVGDAFAEQARQMHHGELENRAIRGRVAADEAQVLMEEGIALLPIPDFLKEPLH